MATLAVLATLSIPFIAIVVFIERSQHKARELYKRAMAEIHAELVAAIARQQRRRFEI